MDSVMVSRRNQCLFIQPVLTTFACVLWFGSGAGDAVSLSQEWIPVEHFPDPHTAHEHESLPMVDQYDEPLQEQEYEYSDHAVAEPVDSPAGCNCQGKCNGKCHGVSLDPGHPAKPKHKKPGDIDEGDCPSIRYRMDDCLRSGDPYCVYKWAAPSITDKYSAWYVGGGAAFRGRGRTSAEGTWGLDYDGLFGHARTWLNYTCGKRQGGEGAYETDHVKLKKKLSAMH
jgi:hypothetical protein